MEDFALIDVFVDKANASGEEFNDGDEWPGWMCGEWVENTDGTHDLEITYTNPEKGETVQRYRVWRAQPS